MNSFKIITDSSCDLTPEQYKEFDIDFVPYLVSFDGVTYKREHLDISVSEFYDELNRTHVFAKTSLPGVQQYIDAFKPYLDQGIDIICVCLSSKFSGSFQSAKNAQLILTEEYPQRNIFILDSYNATGGQGLIVFELAKMRDSGMDIRSAFELIEQLKKTVTIVFTIDSLEYLQKGGRIGLVSSLAGSLLNIKPIIKLLDGELKPFSKIRGRKKAIHEVINIITQEYENVRDDYEFYVLNADCLEDAQYLVSILEQEHGIRTCHPISDVGVTIGCHTGPSAIGIGAIKKYNRL